MGGLRQIRIAATAALAGVAFAGATAGDAFAVPDLEPGAVGTKAHTRASVEMFGAGLGDSAFWTQTVPGTAGVASSTYDSPTWIGTDPRAACPGEDACGGWTAAARGGVNVAAGRMRALAEGRMWISHANAAGYVFVDGAALIDDTITLPEPATVTLTGRLRGILTAHNNDHANQGNDPKAAVDVALAFSRERSEPCEDEWCPPHERLGGYAETLEPTVVHGPAGPFAEIDERFSVEVDLPAGTTNFNAELVSSLDYQVYGSGDRLADKRARLDFHDTLTFEILVPEEVAPDATSGSGLLPLAIDSGGSDPDAAASARAREMRADGANCTAIALAMQSEHARTARQTAAILRSIDCGAVEAGAALVEAYGLEPDPGAQALADAGYGPQEVAEAAKVVWAQSAPAAAGLLRRIGFNATQIARGLKHVYARTASAAGAILKTLGYNASQVAAAAKAVYSKTAAATAALLKSLGFKVGQIAAALASVYARSATAVAGLLKGLGYGAGQVASALRSGLGLAAKATATALKAAGYGATAVAQALKGVWGFGWAKTADLLKAAGFGVAAVKSAVCAVFGRQC